MKLILDMRHLTGQMHGMARYALELLGGVLDLDADLAVGALVRRPEDAQALPADPRLVAIALDLAPYGLGAQLRLPKVLAAMAHDLYHCPFYAPPALYAGPMVVTIHDLIHLRFPQDHGLKHRLFYRYVVAPGARRARAVLTVSRHSRDDLVELLGVDPAKVVVTPNGVGEEFQPLPARERPAAAQAAGLPADYILGVGNPKPHKNLGALVAAYGRLRRQAGPESPPPPLVVVGAGPADLAGCDTEGVTCIPHLAAEVLPGAYAAARLVVVPSLYEGFGLPALEALAAGAPLVCSDRASLPEVVGEAGLLVPPDPEPLAQAMARLLADTTLANRLRGAGPPQAAAFTWRETARATLRVYRRVAAGEKP